MKNAQLIYYTKTFKLESFFHPYRGNGFGVIVKPENSALKIPLKETATFKYGLLVLSREPLRNTQGILKESRENVYKGIS